MTRSCLAGGPRVAAARSAFPPLALFNPVEGLETRVLLTIFTVTTTADSGPGSLRQAILDANASAGADAIRFDVPGGAGAVRTIRPASPLPALAGPVALDGTTQAGYAGSPLVELDGSAAGSAAHGLTITGTDVVVRGLAVNRFARNGIVVAGEGARVEASYVGTDATGDAAAGNGGAGVYISGGAAVVGGTSAARRNVISGNRLAGVWVVGQAAAVLGNSIGTDVTGAWPLGNGGSGVFVDGARDAVVGGAEAGAGNLISGNGASGVRVGPGASATVQGNRIGTDAFGARDVPNGTSVTTSYRDGVTADHVGSLLVGGAEAAARNVISGNAGSGVGVLGRGAVQVRGNYIGTDATGSVAVGNAGDGVSFGDLATVSGVGITLFAVQNIISGNGRNGVRITASQVGGPVIRVNGNFIGTNAAGAAPLGNAGAGVLVQGGAAEVGNLRLGLPHDTSTASGRNVISANGGHGVHVVGDLGLVNNNYVGTDLSGRVALGNGGHGVLFENARGRVGTGTTHPYSGGLGNVIAGNRGNGVMVVGTASGASIRPGVDVRSNRIGTDAAGDAANPALGNGGHGVAVVNASAVRVGGDSSGGEPGGNTIAFNGGSGVYVEGPNPGSSGSPGSAAVVLSNSIFSNARLGIDLASADPASGVTLNDPGDEDRGPNTLLNYPVITSAMTRPAGTTVRVNVVPGTRVEFFASPTPDPSGFGEGQTLLLSVSLPDGVPSGGVMSVTLPPVPVGTYITATASTQFVTSEFSPAVAAEAGPPVEAVGRYMTRPFVLQPVLVPGKRALRPGEAPSFDHITNSAAAVAGVALEGLPLALPALLTRDDFSFRRSGNRGDGGPVTWSGITGPLPAVQAGAGPAGTDRIIFDVRTLSVLDRWLEVTVLPTERTGLARPEVFYFGNLAGETGDAGSPFHVTALDVAAVKGALGTTEPVLVARHDFTGDGRVDALDLAAVKTKLSRRLSPPTAPPPTARAPAPTPEGDDAAPGTPRQGVWESLLREEEVAA